MTILNKHPDFGCPLQSSDAEMFGEEAAQEVERFLSYRENHAETPLHCLPVLASDLGVSAIYVKDEGHRLGLGSFKALGGAYAVIRLVLDEAGRRFGRRVDIAELQTSAVKAVAATMTVACATDGNHGRSVAQGAQLVGARARIFVHSGVSAERMEAIALFGAQVIRVAGTYDDSVAETARIAANNGWIVVSDTSWQGYEYIPALVMQGYTVMVREILRQVPHLPTHVFVQSGVGGVAAAVAAHLSVALGEQRPVFVVVDPARAACLYESARAGHPVRVEPGEPTVMAMLECYEPSRVGWRMLVRVADAFMTIDEEDAIAAMNRLARPTGNDVAIVAGESGGAGLAGLMRAVATPADKSALGLDATSRVLVINTEGATDPGRYLQLVGMSPAEVVAGA
ncbi:diaminopropionate ammonia-lyase [Ochrobactrum vermis]|uniref:Diaminopropionate ammonia-lyase n=1 Tax=Ochrobactrum vermis TaxID=1827297 RepID=A0ABU8PHM7_9HYPH|nr:diaminopropionate ammonia-lyase [Ochrobactrum vermis]PQZ27055.1 diaminopropionate ammonia-lyase [Ochrobactrum vermis]